MPDKEETDPDEGSVHVPLRGCLTSPDDPTVGGGGWPYAGIGYSGLRPEQKVIGEEQHKQIFPTRH